MQVGEALRRPASPIDSPSRYAVQVEGLSTIPRAQPKG